MPTLVYTSFKRRIGDGTFDLDNSATVLKCALLTSAHVPSAAHAVLADVSADEVSGTGYAAGGLTLTDVTWTTVETAAVLDAANPTWSNANITARYAVVYLAGTSNGVTNPLICLLDFGADKGVAGGTFAVVFDTAGILTLS